MYSTGAVSYKERETTLKTLKSTIFHFNTNILRFRRNKTFRNLWNEKLSHGKVEVVGTFNATYSKGE